MQLKNKTFRINFFLREIISLNLLQFTKVYNDFTEF